MCPFNKTASELDIRRVDIFGKKKMFIASEVSFLLWELHTFFIQTYIKKAAVLSF